MLRISVEAYAGVTTKDEYENYHLSLEYKWGDKKYAPRVNEIRDSGVINALHRKTSSSVGRLENFRRVSDSRRRRRRYLVDRRRDGFGPLPQARKETEGSATHLRSDIWSIHDGSVNCPQRW